MFIFRKVSRKDGKMTFATQTLLADAHSTDIEDMARIILHESNDTIEVQAFKFVGALKEVVKAEWNNVSN